MKRIDESNAHLHQSGFIGGFYIRPMRLEPGEVHQGHEHHVDHVTVIRKGRVRIEYRNPRAGEEDAVEITEPCKLLIKAEVWHKFVAYDEPVEWECWFVDTEEARAGAGKNG